MTGDLLLEWMTHLGTGSWISYREAVEQLSRPAGEELETASRGLRIALSDFGHTDFFIDGTKRWRVLQPALVDVGRQQEYVFVGGRTRRLTDKLASVAKEVGASLSMEAGRYGLSRIAIKGEQAAVRDVAKALSATFIPAAALQLASALSSLSQKLQDAPICDEPIGWSVRSLSFRDGAWVPEELPEAAREYSNRHGVRRYVVHQSRVGLREMSKREAVYGAALLNGIRIVKFGYESQRLAVPLWAPLPGEYSRTAALAAGALAQSEGSDLVYAPVAQNIAATMLIALGQGYPNSGELR